MSTALEQRRNATALEVLSTDAGWSRFKDVAGILSAGGTNPTARMVPEAFKDAQQIQAGLLFGFSLGYDLLGAIALLQHLHPVRGRMTPDYHWKLNRVYKHIPTWRWGLNHSDANRCEAWFRRAPDHETFTVSYTIEEAKQAKLVKTDSAWETNPKAMLRKTVITQGITLTAEDALFGVPPDQFEQLDDDVAPAAGPSSAVVLDPEKVAAQVFGGEAGGEQAAVTAKGASSGPQGAPPVPPQAPKVEAPQVVGSAREVFIVEAKKKGWNINHGPTVYKLLQELLTEADGVAPTWKKVNEVPTNDWRLAYARLCERYPNGKPAAVVEQPERAAQAQEPAAGTPPPPPDESGAAPPEESVEQLRAEGERADEEQMQDRAFLQALGEELERLWKQPGVVIMSRSDGKWFVHRDTLIECGFTLEGGASKPMALFETKHAARNLTPQQTYALSYAVKRRLRELAMRR
jgi:hypothetical protein